MLGRFPKIWILSHDSFHKCWFLIYNERHGRICGMFGADEPKLSREEYRTRLIRKWYWHESDSYYGAPPAAYLLALIPSYSPSFHSVDMAVQSCLISFTPQYWVGLKGLHGFEFPSAAPWPPTVCLTAIFGKIGRKSLSHIQGSRIRLVRGLVKFVPAH